MAFEVLSKRYSKTDIPWCCSATMADRAVLKPVGVDMPFDLGIPISKYRKICLVFLVQRMQGTLRRRIPDLTAVWVHFSTFAWEGVGWGSSAGR